MARLDPGLSDEPFQAYLFHKAADGDDPPRIPRLWFLDRHLIHLVGVGPYPGPAVGFPTARGLWTLEVPDELLEHDWPSRNPIEVVAMAMPGLLLRYETVPAGWPGIEEWSAVWRLTDTTIPPDPRDAARGFGIHTFGRDDDVWRLGVWPD